VRTEYVNLARKLPGPRNDSRYRRRYAPRQGTCPDRETSGLANHRDSEYAIDATQCQADRSADHGSTAQSLIFDRNLRENLSRRYSDSFQPVYHLRTVMPCSVNCRL
jgi:hypothetical protein